MWWNPSLHISRWLTLTTFSKIFLKKTHITQHFGLSLLEAELRLKGVLDDYDFAVRANVGDSLPSQTFFGGRCNKLAAVAHEDRTEEVCNCSCRNSVCFMWVDRCLMFCSQSDDSRKKPCSHRGHYASYWVCVCVCGSSNLSVFTWDFSVRYFKNTRLKTRVKMRFFSRCIDFLLHLPKIKSLPWNGVFTSWGSCFCPAKWDCVHIFTSPRCD